MPVFLPMTRLCMIPKPRHMIMVLPSPANTYSSELMAPFCEKWQLLSLFTEPLRWPRGRHAANSALAGFLDRDGRDAKHLESR